MRLPWIRFKSKLPPLTLRLIQPKGAPPLQPETAAALIALAKAARKQWLRSQTM